MTAVRTLQGLAQAPAAVRPLRPGLVVLGADYRALGVVRSLGRRGLPIWVVRHGDDRLASLSRYVRGRLALPAGAPEEQVDFLLDAARRFHLHGFALLPTADDTAELVARHHAQLAAVYRVAVAPWEVLRIALDKRLAYAAARGAGIPCPRTFEPRGPADLERLDWEYPLLLKPAVKPGRNRLTTAKAWRVDSPAELRARYAEACALVSAEAVTVQELIPGGGESQLAFAALVEEGAVIASITAERTRQYPMDFGRASTYVRSIDDEEVAALAERLLAHIGFTGLVEVEFKRDPRDGRCKLLDLNPRPWGWHTLSCRAGVDFPFLLWQRVLGRPVPRLRGRPGVSWMRLSTDLPVALRELACGRLSLRDYLSSFAGPRERAIFAPDDPVPGLLELPLLALTVARRLARRSPV